MVNWQKCSEKEFSILWNNEALNLLNLDPCFDLNLKENELGGNTGKGKRRDEDCDWLVQRVHWQATYGQEITQQHAELTQGLACKQRVRNSSASWSKSGASTTNQWA